MPVTPGDRPDTDPRPLDDDRADQLARLMAERFGADAYPRHPIDNERGAAAVAPESRDLL